MWHLYSDRSMARLWIKGDLCVLLEQRIISNENTNPCNNPSSDSHIHQ